MYEQWTHCRRPSEFKLSTWKFSETLAKDDAKHMMRGENMLFWEPTILPSHQFGATFRFKQHIWKGSNWCISKVVETFTYLWFQADMIWLGRPQAANPLNCSSCTKSIELFLGEVIRPSTPTSMPLKWAQLSWWSEHSSLDEAYYDKH